jgi:hypothetical protein
MPLPRMTTRRWMVVVAVVGLALCGTEVLRRRHNDFAYRAELHARTLALLKARQRVAARNDPVLSRVINYYESLARKCRHAARYPWISVEPDPPEPD